jgi:hypothetical protein
MRGGLLRLLGRRPGAKLRHSPWRQSVDKPCPKLDTEHIKLP